MMNSARWRSARSSPKWRDICNKHIYFSLVSAVRFDRKSINVFASKTRESETFFAQVPESYEIINFSTPASTQLSNFLTYFFPLPFLIKCDITRAREREEIAGKKKEIARHKTWYFRYCWLVWPRKAKKKRSFSTIHMLSQLSCGGRLTAIISETREKFHFHSVKKKNQHFSSSSLCICWLSSLGRTSRNSGKATHKLHTQHTTQQCNAERPIFDGNIIAAVDRRVQTDECWGLKSLTMGNWNYCVYFHLSSLDVVSFLLLFHSNRGFAFVIRMKKKSLPVPLAGHVRTPHTCSNSRMSLTCPTCENHKFISVSQRAWDDVECAVCSKATMNPAEKNNTEREKKIIWNVRGCV